MTKPSHIDEQGRARMVDVSHKVETLRIARAGATLTCLAETATIVREGKAPKGAVIATAELAGMMAAKRTSELIPLCHPLPLTQVVVTIDPDDSLPGFRLIAEASTRAATGVEMEALTAVSVASLTLFDMLKAVDRTMVIGDIRVLAKSGGTSGDWESQKQ